MEIQGLYNSSSTQATPQVGEAGGALGKNEFMKMLVAQMQNQDPMEPVDNAQMTAQLAQFSALEQMENLNSQFENFQHSTSAATSLMNAGKPIQLELLDGSTVEGTLEKVQWFEGETLLVVDGSTYSFSDVKSLTANEATPAEAQEEETA